MMRQFGCVYLILGTCIAAGMLGLPIVTAKAQFWLTSLMVLSAWVLMTVGAFCLLQVNLWLKPGTNLITMSNVTLGPWIKWLTWFVYLLLLYSLICAYLAAGGDVLKAIVAHFGWKMPRTLATVLVTVILGAVVYRGIYSVDISNRILMTVKIVICLILISGLMPHVQVSQLSMGDARWRGTSWLVIICAFGYAIILPSIRVYLDSNRRQLQRVVLVGSFIPMLLYLIWIIVVQGTIARQGAHGLIAMNGVADTNSLLMKQLVMVTHYGFIKTLSVVFLSVCSITGFLGVSLCLMDFLADGLQRQKHGKHKLMLALLTFLPPMLIVLLRPEIFIHALAYAGLCCIYILIILPVAMYIAGRHKRLHLAST